MTMTTPTTKNTADGKEATTMATTSEATSAALMSAEERALIASRLGTFILDQLPYGADITFPELTLPSSTIPVVSIPTGYHATSTVERDGLYANNTSSQPYTPEGFPSNGDLLNWDNENDGKLKQWEMKSAHHQITKQLRIWYTYVQKNQAGQTRLRGTWLMIGYSGDGH